MKNKILETIINNKLFSKYVNKIEIEEDPNRYYIIPLIDKTNIFSDTLNNTSQPNTVIEIKENYLYVYSTSIANRMKYYKTKEKIDLSKYSKLKYHFEVIENSYSDNFNIQIGSTVIGTFKTVKEYKGEISLTNYNSSAYISINPLGASVKFYYFYLEE